jgi:hypothetical protein
MEMHKLIGILVGPVIHTEAANFMKKFFVCWELVAIFSCLYSQEVCWISKMCANHDVTEYLGTFHTSIWSRSEFNEICKVGYFHKILPSHLTARSRNWSFFQWLTYLTRSGNKSWRKFDLGERIALKFEGLKFLPSVVSALNTRSRGLMLRYKRGSDHELKCMPRTKMA